MADLENPDSVTSIKPDDSEVVNLKKQLTDAQTKITEQGGQLQKQAQYVQDADAVAKLIEANPALHTQLKEAYEKQYGGGVVDKGEDPSKQSEEDPKKKNGPPEADPKVEELGKDVGELKRNQKREAIQKFENASGITDLPEEQRKEVRRNIEEYLNTFGQTVANVSVDLLPAMLDNAHKAINVEKMVADGKMEGMAELYSNQSGIMPHMQGRRLETEKEDELTPGQMEWAKKLNVSPERAKEVDKGKDSEQTRISVAEVKKEQRDSGKTS